MLRKLDVVKYGAASSPNIKFLDENSIVGQNFNFSTNISLCTNLVKSAYYKLYFKLWPTSNVPNSDCKNNIFLNIFSLILSLFC